MINHYFINPCAKPRMTRSDRWKKRPIVCKYWKFKDKVRELGIEFPPQGASITFIIEMPKSWSNKKREETDGKPHQQTPDLDNLVKGLADAIYADDAHIWQIKGLEKRWGEKGKIEVEYER